MLMGLAQGEPEVYDAVGGWRHVGMDVPRDQTRWIWRSHVGLKR